jgi:uncharacterized protein with HEPN domain
MSEKRLSDYLDHLVRAASDACNFVAGMSKDEFLADKRTQQAVVMSLVIIGEAATRLMDRFAEFAEHHPEVPWRNMRGMRNRIAHGYFDINRSWRLPPPQTTKAHAVTGPSPLWPSRKRARESLRRLRRTFRLILT